MEVRQSPPLTRRVLTSVDAVVAYVCLFDFVRMHGVVDSPQPWDKKTSHFVADLIDSLHKNNMECAKPYGSSKLEERGWTSGA